MGLKILAEEARQMELQVYAFRFKNQVLLKLMCIEIKTLIVVLLNF